MDAHREFELLTVCVHVNGECRIDRSGFRGSEYYQYDSMLARVSDFSCLKLPVNASVYFCDGDGELDFYEPSVDEAKKISGDLSRSGASIVNIQDVPNVVAKDGGLSVIPEFYKQKDLNMVRWVAASPYAESDVLRRDLECGFPEMGLGIMYVK